MLAELKDLVEKGLFTQVRDIGTQYAFMRSKSHIDRGQTNHEEAYCVRDILGAQNRTKERLSALRRVRNGFGGTPQKARRAP